MLKLPTPTVTETEKATTNVESSVVQDDSNQLDSDNDSNGAVADENSNESKSGENATGSDSDTELPLAAKETEKNDNDLGREDVAASSDESEDNVSSNVSDLGRNSNDPMSAENFSGSDIGPSSIATESQGTDKEATANPGTSDLHVHQSNSDSEPLDVQKFEEELDKFVEELSVNGIQASDADISLIRQRCFERLNLSNENIQNDPNQQGRTNKNSKALQQKKQGNVFLFVSNLNNYKLSSNFKKLIIFSVY